MSKLGYTWYPKDWNNSDAVFELTLEQRGLYRELIDIAMLNDNKTVLKESVWCRKWGVSSDKLIKLIESLMVLELLNFNGEDIFIPSCENRLKLVRAGSKGGKKSKPNAKPTVKPNAKQNSNQIEKKEKENIKENKIKDIPSFSVFKDFSIERAERLKKIIDFSRLELKYESWVENDWRDGNDVPIKNWKTKLLNSLPYLWSDKKKIKKPTENLPM
jgi:hypothetical protein